MNTRYFILLVTLLFYGTCIKAQDSKFLLLDSETKKPIPYANICFENIETGKAEYMISSLNGYFTNNNKGDIKIAISFAGYKTIIDTIISGDTKTYYLESDIFNLSQIVITATQTEKTLKDAPVITQIISAKQIENQGFTNMKEVLSAEVPGLDFQQVGFGTDINIQGMSAKNILILVDGEMLAGENGNNIDYSRLNTENIEKIEIVKGASSALYGSQAMGGVINIITKEPRKKFEINVGGKYKGYNQINFPYVADNDNIYKSKLDLPNLNLNASVGFNLNNIVSQTVFSSKSFDAYQLVDKHDQFFDIINIDTTITLPAAISNINGYEDFTISQKIKITPSDNWEFNFRGSYYLHNKYDFYDDNKYQQFNDITFGGDVKYKLSKNSEIFASINHDSYDKYDFYEKLDEKEINYTNTFIHPKLVFSTKLFNNHQFIIGSEFLNEFLLSDKFEADTITDKSVNTSVLFFQDDFDFNKKINLTVGVRTDYHSTFGLHASPKISFMYKFGSHRFRLNYATGFRSPTLKELYMNWDLLGIFTIKGNENLKPETNQYISASAEYTKNNFNSSINVYNNWFNNKIEGQWEDNQTVYHYVNLDKTTLTGVELMLKYHFIKHFNISGGYSFIHDERNPENQMSTTSPHAGTLRIEYTFRKGIYNLNVNLSGKLTGAKNYQTYNEIEYQGEYVKAWYDVYYNAFSIWNLSISQRLYNSLNLIIGIDNMFNYKADIINFNTTINPGRRYFISLQMDIDKFFNKSNKTIN